MASRLKRFEVPEGNNPPQATGVTISGPYNITGPGNTPSRARIFVCRPAGDRTKSLARAPSWPTLARRAFRRPVTTPTSSRCWPSTAAAAESGISISASRRRCGRCWFRPIFCSASSRTRRARARHRLSHQRSGTGVAVVVLPVEQRSRRRVARSGGEGQAEGPRGARPAGAPAAGRSARAMRWWRISPASGCTSQSGRSRSPIRMFSRIRREPAPVPSSEETELFFQNILREDRSVMELLDAELHVPEPASGGALRHPAYLRRAVPQGDADRSESRRTAGAGQHSHGDLLSQPHVAWCSAGSGFWTTCWARRRRRRRRCSGSEAARPGRQPLTMRERWSSTASNADLPVLPRAHGSDRLRAGELRWRGQVAGQRCAARRSMPPASCPAARNSSGPAGLKKLLVSNYRDQFDATVTEKLLTYALGRGLEYYDKPAVRSIMRQAARDNYRMSAADHRHRQEHAVSNEEDSGTMIITKKSLPRRTFLRGLGTTLALPLLDSMIPALCGRPQRSQAAGPPGLCLSSGRHDPEQVDAGRGRHGLRVHAHHEGAGAVPRTHHSFSPAWRRCNGRALGRWRGRSCARRRDVADRRTPEEDRRRRHPRGHLGGPDCRPGVGQEHAVGFARTRSGESVAGGRLRFRL